MDHRLTRFHISGFRRLYNLDLEMRPLMVLIGANGVGKTSLLDAFMLLAASAEGRLSATVSALGGMNAIISANKAESLVWSIEAKAPRATKYTLGLNLSGASYSISHERLHQQQFPSMQDLPVIESLSGAKNFYDFSNEKQQEVNWKINPQETILSQLPRSFAQPEEFKALLSSAALYNLFDAGARAPARLPQMIRPAALPSPTGDDLLSYLYFLREIHPDRFELVEDTLRAAFPGFEKLNFPAVAAGMMTLTWKDQNFATPLYMHQLSEGTIRFLFLVSLLQSPELPKVTLIDEPEVSLHPEFLSLLADLLREASLRSQIVVATHSDRLVRFLEPKEVLAMDLGEDGGATATWADSFDLEEWLKDYSLDQVWSKGLIGARS